MKRQGMLKVHCSFSAEKNQLVAAIEHRNLTRLLLLHHLDSQKVSVSKSKYFFKKLFFFQGNFLTETLLSAIFLLRVLPRVTREFGSTLKRTRFCSYDLFCNAVATKNQ